MRNGNEWIQSLTSQIGLSTHWEEPGKPDTTWLLSLNKRGKMRFFVTKKQDTIHALQMCEVIEFETTRKLVEEVMRQVRKENLEVWEKERYQRLEDMSDLIYRTWEKRINATEQVQVYLQAAQVFLIMLAKTFR